MKRLSFCLAILLLLSFGLAYAQPPGNTAIRVKGTTVENGVVHGSGLGANDSVLYTADGVLKFGVEYVNRDIYSYNPGNGFKIYSPDGATWAHATPNGGNYKMSGPHSPQLMPGIWVDSTGVYPRSDFLAVYKFNLWGADGAGVDTMAFAGASGDASQLAVRPADSGIFFYAKIRVKAADWGKHICFDSTTLFPNNQPWKWASTGVPTPPGNYSAYPNWVGPYCWTLAKLPNMAPEFTNCAGGTKTGSHCGSFTWDFDATDAEQNPIVFSLISGPGSIDATTGVWSATGLATGVYAVKVGATDPTGSGQTTECPFTITATNVAPTIACPATKSVSTGETVTSTITATDDCDTKTFSIISTNASDPLGYGIDPVTGVLSYTGNVDDVANSPICFVVGVSDGLETAECTACFNVIKGCKYKVKIQAQAGGGSGVIQGTVQTVDVTLEGADQVAGLGGFNLLIAYDNSALSFQSAAAGAIYGLCNWEYFTYRYGADGNCSGGCPSGLIRLIGIAETNNGSPRAGCQPPDAVPTGVSLAQLSFLVSNNRTLECQLVPIRFFWVECGDNTLSSADGSKLYVSCSVKDLFGDPIATPDAALPSYMGAPEFCVTSTQKAFVKREVDFVNGYIKIICGKDIDARGDVNLNGQSYEIADAVMFTNYFITGLSAFMGHADGSIAATDVNADGLALTVADLVYLIRVIVGDALPYPKPTSLSVNVTADNDGISITGAELGAVFMTLKGDVTPTLATTNAEMAYAFDGTNTRVLVHAPFDINHYGMPITGFSGDIINVSDAEIVSIDMADIHGYAVKEALPTEYALFQNYPNPFNPSTKISFAMPVAGDYTITIYNVTGQKVAVLSGTANSASIVTEEWNASKVASGVYFYKLETAGFTATKKAVLLK
ncbi:MAG: T9SS type A sorting domain-containing protein [candidate division Zixibacteria bacterium]|nr:T9SS type A sorting domain-containing protein [candidate division Zixibacteria bacterium]